MPQGAPLTAGSLERTGRRRPQRDTNAYRVDRTYLWNYEHGPSLEGPLPAVPGAPGMCGMRGVRAAPLKDLMGLRVASRFGISAGILLNSRWIEAFARLGFDLLTYKTVRSARRSCYPLPNWVYLEPAGPGRGARGRGRGPPVFRRRARMPRDVRHVTSAVCFGMPCMEPAVWRADVRRARRVLGRGQALVVSVVGTPRGGGKGPSLGEALAEDYVRCARWAAEAGAHAVEANLSCPNVCTAEGQVYQDPELSRALAAALRDALPSTPLLLKAGRFESRARLEAFYRAVEGKADAVVLVNGVSGRVVDELGEPVFRGHEAVGILGRWIHGRAVRNVREAVAASRAEGLRTLTIAVGGVLSVEDAADFFNAGAAAVLAGGGAALDPGLAARVKAARPEW
ncbi:MAG: hypothetical protein HY721_32940 [Planctomycetes bacterium]|nr:hypothetical protein [Planctomycetota bacterium]